MTPPPQDQQGRPSAWAKEKARRIIADMAFFDEGRIGVIALALDAAFSAGEAKGAEQEQDDLRPLLGRALAKIRQLLEQTGHVYEGGEQAAWVTHDLESAIRARGGAKGVNDGK